MMGFFLRNKYVKLNNNAFYRYWLHICMLFYYNFTPYSLLHSVHRTNVLKSNIGTNYIVHPLEDQYSEAKRYNRIINDHVYIAVFPLWNVPVLYFYSTFPHLASAITLQLAGTTWRERELIINLNLNELALWSSRAIVWYTCRNNSN